MKRDMDLAHKTCRIDAYKFNIVKLKPGRDRSKGIYVYTATKGELIYSGTLKVICEKLNAKSSSFESGFYLRKKFKGFELTRQRNEL